MNRGVTNQEVVALSATLELPILTPRALRDLRDRLDDETFVALKAAIDQTVTKHVGPFLRGGSASPDVALSVATARYLPLRLELLRLLARSFDATDIADILRGYAQFALDVLDAEGWRLGPDRDAFARGVAKHRDLVAWLGERLDTLDVPERGPAAERLLLSGTTTDLCLTSVMLVLEGEVDLDSVDPARLAAACRAVEPNVAEARGILDELLGGTAGEVSDLAGAWGSHPDDDEVLKSIYDARLRDAD